MKTEEQAKVERELDNEILEKWNGLDLVSAYRHELTHLKAQLKQVEKELNQSSIVPWEAIFGQYHSLIIINDQKIVAKVNSSIKYDNGLLVGINEIGFAVAETIRREFGSKADSFEIVSKPLEGNSPNVSYCVMLSDLSIGTVHFSLDILRGHAAWLQHVEITAYYQAKTIIPVLWDISRKFLLDHLQRQKIEGMAVWSDRMMKLSEAIDRPRV